MRLFRRVSLLLALPTLAFAQQPDSAAARAAARDSARARAARDSVQKLPTIEVVGSIIPTAGPTIGSGVPARVTTIDREQIEASEPRVLSDVLSTQAGFSAYDDLGSPYKLNLSTRGFYSSPVVGLPQGVSVFLDGIRMNEPDAAQVNFDLLPMEQVKRIELLSGTASLLGRNSLGGAVNLITERGEGRVHGELEASGGSFGMGSGEGSVGGMSGGWDYFVSGGYEREDGWRQATEAELFNGFINLGRRTPTKGIVFQLLGARSNAKTAGSLPESVFDVQPDSNLSANDFEHLKQFQFALSGYARAGRGRLAASTYVRRHTAERFNANQEDDPDALGKSANTSIGGTLDYRWGYDVGRGRLDFRVGAEGTSARTRVELFADSTKFDTGITQTTDVKAPTWDVAGFALADWRVGRLTLSAGARYDYIRVPFHNQLDPTRDTTSTFKRLSPRMGVSVDVGGGSSVYASFGQSFRAPAVIEIACADPEEPCPLPFALGDDPPIDPVLASTFEVGAQVVAGPVLFGASAYRTAVKNDIFLFPFEEEDEPSGSTIDGYFGNLSRTRREGVELTSRVFFGRGHSAYLNYAYTRATFQTEAEIFSIREDADAGITNEVEPGDRMPLVPDHQVKGGATLVLPARIKAGFDARYIGHQWLRGDEANNTSPLDGYFVADARASVDFGPWELAAVVNNVFQNKYATFGTFNINQGAGDVLERFLSPGQRRAVRFIVRRSFGGDRD